MDMKLFKVVTSFLAVIVLSSGLAFASGQLNINTASQQELEMLSGVGPSTAAAIIEYREQNGAFVTVEELVNVKGIGDKKLQQILEHVTVSQQ